MNLDYSFNPQNVKYKDITLFRSKEKRCFILLGSHPKDRIYGII